jgi:hypothetical protein
MTLESQRRANKKYAVKNREKLNNYMKERYKRMKEENPEKWKKYINERIAYRKNKNKEPKGQENVEENVEEISLVQ